MNDIRIIMKDGGSKRGSLWEWQPKEGWFSITSNHKIDVIRFSLAARITNSGSKTSIANSADGDLLKKALRDGWDGVS